MRPPAPSLMIAIPARNEADRIDGCLAALHGQREAPPFGILLLANNCTDATAAIALGWRDRLPGLQVVCAELPPAQANAGEARRMAMAAAAALVAPSGVLLTTDADTRAPSDWVSANLAALRGVDAVCGRAVIDPVEAQLIPPHLHALDALECRYAKLLDEIASLLMPLPHDPWPRHDEHSGASIAVRVPAYQAAGGIPRQPSGEDRAFCEALRRAGARIRHAPEVWVTVSGRLEGRAQGGMADTMRARIQQPPQWLDDRLEPVEDRIARLTGMNGPPVPRRVGYAQVEAEIAAATGLRDRLRRMEPAAWAEGMREAAE